MESKTNNRNTENSPEYIGESDPEDTTTEWLTYKELSKKIGRRDSYVRKDVATQNILTRESPTKLTRQKKAVIEVSLTDYISKMEGMSRDKLPEDLRKKKLQEEIKTLRLRQKRHESALEKERKELDINALKYISRDEHEKVLLSMVDIISNALKIWRQHVLLSEDLKEKADCERIIQSVITSLKERM